MTTGTDMFSRLPTPVVSTVLEYCAPKDVLALSFTCRTFQNFVKCSMCMVHELNYNSVWRIPIYFADQCHSVFVMCEFHTFSNIRSNEIYDVSVRSRSRHLSGGQERIVWQAVRHVHPGIMARSHISFRNDPSQDYFLHTVPRYYNASTRNTCQLQKQFMTTTSTHLMENTIKNCLLLQNKYCPVSEDWSKRHPMDNMRLLMKLFVFCSETLSEESTAFRTFFTSSRVGQGRIRLIKKQILNFLEQIFEQQEPAFCVKQLLSSVEMAWNGQLDPDASHPQTQNTNVVSTPYLAVVDFSWERSTKRQSMDQDDSLWRGHGLEFVARIPMAHKSTCLTWSACINTDAQCKAFIFFFQRRQSSQISSEKQMDAKVLSCHGISGLWTVELELDKEYEACFLYVVPGKTKSISIRNLKVELKVAADDHNSDFCYWMDAVMKNHICGGPRFPHRLFLIGLLRTAVLALLGQDRERFTTLKQDLEMEGLVTTPEGLQSMLLICDVILRDWPEDSVSS